MARRPGDLVWGRAASGLGPEGPSRAPGVEGGDPRRRPAREKPNSRPPGARPSEALSLYRAPASSGAVFTGDPRRRLGRGSGSYSLRGRWVLLTQLGPARGRRAARKLPSAGLGEIEPRQGIRPARRLRGAPARNEPALGLRRGSPTLPRRGAPLGGGRLLPGVSLILYGQVSKAPPRSAARPRRRAGPGSPTSRAARGATEAELAKAAGRRRPPAARCGGGGGDRRRGPSRGSTGTGRGPPRRPLPARPRPRRRRPSSPRGRGPVRPSPRLGPKTPGTSRALTSPEAREKRNSLPPGALR